MDLSQLDPNDFIPVVRTPVIEVHDPPQQKRCLPLVHAPDISSLSAALEEAGESDDDPGIWEALEIIDKVADVLDHLVNPAKSKNVDMPFGVYLLCLQTQTKCKTFIDEWLKVNVEESTTDGELAPEEKQIP